MTTRVEVTRLAKSDSTNPRQWDLLTTIASSRKSFKGDRTIKGREDFAAYRKLLGADLIYLHFYLLDGCMTVDKRCRTTGWEKSTWAGIMHAKRSKVLKQLSTPKVVEAFYEHCQIKLNDLVAFYNGDIFNVRVFEGARELANAEQLYGSKNMQRQVAEFMSEYRVDVNHVGTDSTTAVFDRQ